MKNRNDLAFERLVFSFFSSNAIEEMVRLTDELGREIKELEKRMGITMNELKNLWNLIEKTRSMN